MKKYADIIVMLHLVMYSFLFPLVYISAQKIKNHQFGENKGFQVYKDSQPVEYLYYLIKNKTGNKSQIH